MSNKLQGVHDEVLAGNFVDDAGHKSQSWRMSILTLDQ